MLKNKKIVIASNNQGKVAEFKGILHKYNIEVISQSELNVPEVEEPYSTFIENALCKARHCSKITGFPCIADDSGLCVDHLNGEPGVFSAMYAGLPKDNVKNINKLLLSLFGKENRNANYYCSLVYITHEKDPCPIIANGRVNGVISNFPQGSNGFGYDSVFYIPSLKKTMAELSFEEKNELSHRVKAIKEMVFRIF